MCNALCDPVIPAPKVSRVSGETAEALHADGYANRCGPVNAGNGPHWVQLVLGADGVKAKR